MASAIGDWGRFAKEQLKFTQSHKFFGAPLVTHVVSKNFEGKFRQDRVHTLCESPEKCGHLHFPGAFDCNSLAPHECDSEFSRRNLQGSLVAGYHATFGHVDDVGFARSIKEPYEPRGFFFGRFAIENPRPKKVIVDGALDGMINIGIVRRPLAKAVEECHHVGRWYGRVHAEVDLPKDEKAFLTGILALDVEYELTTSWMGTKFVGTLEGMLIRECLKKAS